MPRLAQLLSSDAELDYVEFDGGHSVTNRVAGQVRVPLQDCRLVFGSVCTVLLEAACLPPAIHSAASS